MPITMLKKAAMPIIFLALGFVYTIYAFGYAMGSIKKPGPGVFPVIIGVIWILSSLVVTVRTVFSEKSPKSASGFLPPIPVVSLIAVFAFYCFFLPVLGYLAATFVLLVACLYIFGLKRIWPMLLFAVASSALSYLVFSHLEVPLPNGIWW
jgi:putative tricarboxylic transport membrane protein